MQSKCELPSLFGIVICLTNLIILFVLGEVKFTLEIKHCNK